jgi:hypothetical protein
MRTRLGPRIAGPAPLAAARAIAGRPLSEHSVLLRPRASCRRLTRRTRSAALRPAPLTGLGIRKHSRLARPTGPGRGRAPLPKQHRLQFQPSDPPPSTCLPAFTAHPHPVITCTLHLPPPLTSPFPFPVSRDPASFLQQALLPACVRRDPQRPCLHKQRSAAARGPPRPGARPVKPTKSRRGFTFGALYGLEGAGWRLPRLAAPAQGAGIPPLRRAAMRNPSGAINGRRRAGREGPAGGSNSNRKSVRAVARRRGVAGWGVMKCRGGGRGAAGPGCAPGAARRVRVRRALAPRPRYRARRGKHGAASRGARQHTDAWLAGQLGRRRRGVLGVGARVLVVGRRQQRHEGLQL